MKYCKGCGQLTPSNRCGDCRYWWCSKCLEAHFQDCQKPDSIEERDHNEEIRQKGSRLGNLRAEGCYDSFLAPRGDVYVYRYPLTERSYDKCLSCGEEMIEDQEWEWCHGKCKDLVHKDCIIKTQAKKRKCYLCKDSARHYICQKCRS